MFTENERLRPAPGSCNGQLPYHCTPDRFEGRKPSKSRTCSIVISVRTLSKLTPGTAAPHSLTARLSVQGPFRSLTLYGERERSSSNDQSARCQPAGVRQS